MKDIVRPILVGVGVTVLLLVAVSCASDPKPAQDRVGAAEQNVARVEGSTPTATSTAMPTAAPTPAATPTLAPAPTATPTAIPTPAPTPTATATVPPTPRAAPSFTLGTDRNPNRFTWISGNSADGSVPPDSDGDPKTTGDKDNINHWPIVVRAGETFTITFIGIGGTHRVGLYPPTNPDGCLAGFCDDDLITFDDLEPDGTALLTFKWPTAGEAPYLVCNEHSGTMRTTIKVIP